MVEILKAENHRRMPWKNGGGVTVEIAVHPEGASVDNFDWRISTATVANDGPFSIFPGIDRTLSVLEGNGIVLNVEGTDTLLTTTTEPFSFAADAKSGARLIDGTIIDLNVMTRRGRFNHRVKRLAVSDSVIVEPIDELMLIFCAEGSLDLKTDSGITHLNLHDCSIMSEKTQIPIELNGKGIAYMIAIMKV
ncbi:hutD family protein [Brucella grignonensis]|uniref:HutD family protein n=2 Tax=Brucella grignonensis TaxID=94627 RepID=A0A256FG93_9HYPH|nr:hutD family protein [Brucella grignonensis]